MARWITERTVFSSGIEYYFRMRPLRLLKYLISGGIGLSVNLFAYGFFVEIMGTHYLMGSMLALSLSTVIGFVLQKFWTFEEPSRDRAGMQFVQYAALAVCDLGINTSLVFVLTGQLGLHYLVSQAVGAATVAVINFCIYHFIIFRPRGGGEAKG